MYITSPAFVEVRLSVRQVYDDDYVRMTVRRNIYVAAKQYGDLRERNTAASSAASARANFSRQSMRGAS
jgi:hypothetical protein